jgi:SM-20-related protein
LIGFKLVAFERKITTVLFINSSKDIREIDRDFIGGELLFNFLFDDDGKVFSLKPKAGLLIAFPSCPHFSHEVLEVIDGYRITLVKWFNTITNF